MSKTYSRQDFYQLLKQLNIQTKNQPSDIKQLQKILLHILHYPSFLNFKKYDTASSLGNTDMYSYEEKLLGFIQQDEDYNNLQVCEDCGYIVQNDNLNISTSFEQLNIKPNTYFFFKNYQFIYLFFFLQFFIYFISNYITNNRIGVQKNQLSYFSTQLMICIIVIIWWIVYITRRNKMNNHLIQYEKRYPSVTSFTIMISNYPKKELSINKNDNITHFQQIFNKYSQYSKHYFKVQKVNIAKSYKKQSQEKKKINQRLHKQHKEKKKIFIEWIKQRQYNKQFSILQAQRNQLYQDYENFYHYQFKEYTQIQPTIGQKNIVFVTLQQNLACDQIVQKNQPQSWNNCYNFGQQPYFPVKEVRIERAPQPQQIMWQNNLHLYQTSLTQVFLIFVIGFSLISFSYIMTQIISYSQQKQILRPLVITITNYLIGGILFYVVKNKKYFILTNQNKAIFKTILFFQVINTCIISILINQFNQKQTNLQSDIFYIGAFNLIYPVYKLIDPSYNIIRRFQLHKYKNGINRLQIYGQKQLNRKLQKNQFNFGFQYVYLVNTSIFTALFSSKFPIILLFGSVGIFIYYIASKNNLFYHCKRPKSSNFLLSDIVFKSLMLLPLIYAFGNLIFQKNWLIYVFTLIINACMIFSCINSLCIKKYKQQSRQYHQKYFQTDYDLLNPITQLQAYKQYQQYISLQQQNKQLTNSQKINKFKITSKNNHKISSPRAHMKVTQQMSYLNTKYADKIIRQKKQKFHGQTNQSLKLIDIPHY